MDKTRELGLLVQKGVRHAQTWQWGPFGWSAVEYSAGMAGYNLSINAWFFCIQIGLTRRTT